MVDNVQAVPETSLEELKERHEILCGQLHSLREELKVDPTFRREFLERIEEFLHGLREFTSRMRTTGEYDWLITIASEWQRNYSSVLGIPQDIRKKIGLDRPRRDLKPTRRFFGASEILGHLNIKAYEIGQDRKLGDLRLQLRELQRDHELIHETIKSTDSEAQHDWYYACLLFACDVLDGDIHLVEQMECNALEHLEGVWLEDLKKLKAYVIWESDDEPSDPTCNLAYYYRACQSLHERIRDSAMKSPAQNFARIRSWLQQRYLTNGRVDPTHNPCVRMLVEAKARRIWQRTRADDPVGNWTRAERFVRRFYENIIPAVSEHNYTAICDVLGALQKESNEDSVEVVNAFEAALVVYGIDPELLKSCYEPNTSFV